MRHSHARAVAAAIAGSLAGSPDAAAAGERVWTAVRSLCGQAFEGIVVEGTEPADDAMKKARLVGDDRSRTG